MLDLPLQDWTFDTIRQIVVDYGLESQHFDFKAVLHPSRDEGDKRNQLQESLQRTVCSMANSAGGYVVFGVADSKADLPMDDRLAGMPIRGDLRKEFGDKIASIDPRIAFDTCPQAIAHPTSPDRGFFVVYIPQSPRRPHMAKNVYWTRGDGGMAEQMNSQQVRDLVIATHSGLNRVRLLRQELMTFRAAAFDLQSAQLTMSEVMYRSDVFGFKLFTSEVSVFLPTDKDKWPVTMNLLVVAREAQRLNELLGFYTNNLMMTEKQGWKSEATTVIRDCAKSLFNYSDSALRQLEELFGTDL